MNTPFRFVSTDRRVREDRRFVAGKGRFVADMTLPGTRHVALVTCPYPSARVVTIDKSAALAMPVQQQPAEPGCLQSVQVARQVQVAPAALVPRQAAARLMASRQPAAPSPASRA